MTAKTSSKTSASSTAKTRAPRARKAKIAATPEIEMTTTATPEPEMTETTNSPEPEMTETTATAEPSTEPSTESSTESEASPEPTPEAETTETPEPSAEAAAPVYVPVVPLSYTNLKTGKAKTMDLLKNFPPETMVEAHNTARGFSVLLVRSSETPVNSNLFRNPESNRVVFTSTGLIMEFPLSEMKDKTEALRDTMLAYATL